MPSNPNDIENRVKRQLSDFPFSKRIKLVLGMLSLAVIPGLDSRPYQGQFGPKASRLGALVRNGLFGRAFVRRDHLTLRRYLSQYWGEYATQFHTEWNDRFERLFLGRDLVVIESLSTWLDERTQAGAPVRHLYEIGCGGGRVLAYLANRFPQFEELIGIDLGAERIAANRSLHTDPRLHFHATDAMKWIPAHAQPKSVFIANGGVLEYFLEEELSRLFAWIATECAPTAVVFIETIGTDHDLDAEPQSLVYGREMSFSHNYPRLLEGAGFSIRHRSECEGDMRDGGGRWIRLVASVS